MNHKHDLAPHSLSHPAKGPPYAFYDGEALYYTPIRVEPLRSVRLVMPPPTQFRVSLVSLSGDVPTDAPPPRITDTKYLPDSRHVGICVTFGVHSLTALAHSIKGWQQQCYVGQENQWNLCDNNDSWLDPHSNGRVCIL